MTNGASDANVANGHGKDAKSDSNNSTPFSPKNNQNTKKNKAKQKLIPQKGDPDYLTPTQLRNRRKRRARKQLNQQKYDHTSKTEEGDNHSANGNKRSRSTEISSISRNNNNKRDPSMRYISDPAKAPIVQSAKKFFKPILKDCIYGFHVHLGPLYGWRTVSKLAVRPDTDGGQSKVAIGLFLPQSHTLLPVPNCRAHHPSINRAVECVTIACHEVGIVPYQENGDNNCDIGDVGLENNGGNMGESKRSKQETSCDGVETGFGQLRYIAVNVARDTGGVQITLVWNGHPPRTKIIGEGGKDEGRGFKRKHDGDIEDSQLEELVSKLLSMSGTTSDERWNQSLNNSSSTDGVQREKKRGTSEEESPTKKLRRRGRREVKPTTNDDRGNKSHSILSDGNNAINKNHKQTTTTSNNGNGKKKPKLNLHSLWINYNPSWKHSNAIFAYDSSASESSCWQHVYGPHAIIEHLDFGNNSSQNQNKPEQQQKRGENADGRPIASPQPPSYPIPLHFPPNVFRQANLDAFTHIVGRIRERLFEFGMNKDKERNSGKNFNKGGNHIICIELYGGVGTIGLHLSDTVTSLVSSDENPVNASCFYSSVRTFPAHIQCRLAYMKKNATDMIVTESKLFKQCQVLVVDPPRKGLDVEVVDYLCNEGWKNMRLMVYVSCGFQAFQRDCKALMKSGKWKLEFAEGYLLFPGSDALETLAFFVPV